MLRDVLTSPLLPWVLWIVMAASLAWTWPDPDDWEDTDV